VASANAAPADADLYGSMKQARVVHLLGIALLAWLGSGTASVALGHGAAGSYHHVLARAEAPKKPRPASAAVAWPGRPFAPDSVWNRPLSGREPASPNSRSYVTEVVREVDDYGPWINTYAYSVPVYLVAAGQRTTHVTLDTWGPDLQRAFDAVPLPANAKPAEGADEQLTVWQPSTDRMWEFWKLHRVDGRWHARWGGEMQDVSHNPGYFTHNAVTNDWGATATGLPLLGGLITFADLRQGYINHALAISLVETAPRYWTWPAQRTDGDVFTSGVAQIPEGTRFRLDPHLNIAALHLPPLVRMMAVAAQRYGIIVRDKGGAVAFYGQDPSTTEVNPWGPALQGQYPSNLLRLFPWTDLQALQSTVSCCWGP
jgi:hypothetical protein